MLVNNAFGCTPDTPLFEDAPDETWERDLDLTLTSAFRCSRAALPHLLASGRGAIVNIGSVNGLQDFGNHAYSAAKAGLASLTCTLAGDAARERFGDAGVLASDLPDGVAIARRRLAGIAERQSSDRRLGFRVREPAQGPPPDVGLVQDLNAMRGLERVIVDLDVPSRSGFERLQRPLSFRRIVE